MGRMGRSLKPLEERFLGYGLKDFSVKEIIELLFCHCLTPDKCKKLVNEATKRYATLREFLSAPRKELEKIPGMDTRCILYTELVREIPKEFLKERILAKPVFRTSQEVFDYLYYSMRDLKEEVFKVIYLDNKNRIIETEDLFSGTLDGIHIYPREIEAGAIRNEAAGLIFVHNHPSGDPEPSQNDKQITRDLVFIGKVLQITVVDHIIIGDNRYYSFADDGLITKYEDEFLNLRLRRLKTSTTSI